MRTFNFYQVKPLIPSQKELEPLLEIDRDEKKFQTFLSYHKKNLTIVDMKIFLPFTINLDPYIKKVIKEEISNMEEMGVSIEALLSLPVRLNTWFRDTILNTWFRDKTLNTWFRNTWV